MSLSVTRVDCQWQLCQREACSCLTKRTSCLPCSIITPPPLWNLTAPLAVGRRSEQSVWLHPLQLVTIFYCLEWPARELRCVFIKCSFGRRKCGKRSVCLSDWQESKSEVGSQSAVHNGRLVSGRCWRQHGTTQFANLKPSNKKKKIVCKRPKEKNKTKLQLLHSAWWDWSCLVKKCNVNAGVACFLFFYGLRGGR